MSLVKAKQIDLNDLSNTLITLILSNPAMKSQWGQVIDNAFISKVFSIANANLTLGQSVLSVVYDITPTEILVFRNGVKQIKNADYTITNNVGSFTITLTNAIGPSVDGVLSETVELNYY